MELAHPRDDDVAPAFKFAMRRLASTVTIITTIADDKAAGMTATAVTSLTAEPPAILVCVNKSASIEAALGLGAPMCVNLLAENHKALSHAFGGGLPARERFQIGQWIPGPDRVPILEDAQANLLSTVDKRVDYETHTIIIGRVRTVRLHGDVRPLVFGDGRYLPIQAGST
jgi:flavin reductase (DIM6/NTAB) family NADH-FMN oxidoreductase RutF